MAHVARALARGLTFRCPACGVGRFWTRGGAFPEGCLECSHVYLRDPGDWTGAAETSILVTILVAFGVYAGTARLGLSITARIGMAVAGALAALALVYPRVKGLWIALIYVWDGPVRRVRPAEDNESDGERGAPKRAVSAAVDEPPRARPRPVKNLGTKPRVRR